MAYESLLLSYGLVVGAILISYYHQLKLEKDMVLSSLQATLQLVVMGFLLQMILDIDRVDYLFLILFFMCSVAGGIAGHRGREIPHSYGIAFAGIVAGSLVTFGVLYLAGVIQPEARFAIPIGGMIIGNSMKSASLALNRLIGELAHQRRRIETLLSLGATARQASAGALEQAVRTAMIPTIDTMRTVGVVHLPGIMTGYIIAGGSPLTAVKFQLAIMYMMAGTTDITCIVVTLLAYRQCFTPDLRLLDRFRPAY